MKTVRFDCHGHNSPAYGCNLPGNHSGEYVSKGFHVAEMTLIKDERNAYFNAWKAAEDKLAELEADAARIKAERDAYCDTWQASEKKLAELREAVAWGFDLEKAYLTALSTAHGLQEWLTLRAKSVEELKRLAGVE